MKHACQCWASTGSIGLLGDLDAYVRLELGRRGTMRVDGKEGTATWTELCLCGVALDYAPAHMAHFAPGYALQHRAPSVLLIPPASLSFREMWQVLCSCMSTHNQLVFTAA